MEKICRLWEQVDMLNKILLIILMVSIGSKILQRGILLYAQKESIKYKSDNYLKPCMYKEKRYGNERSYICTHFWYSKRNWEGGTCNQKKCRGYALNISISNELIGSNNGITFFMEMLEILGWLSSYILIFRTIVIK